MYSIRFFKLRNFRGVKEVTISLSSKTENKIVTLIGLNESGKTTVLEGLSLFPMNDRAAASMFKSLPTAHIEASMIPIHETGVFSGEISIHGVVNISKDDLSDIFDFVRSEGYEVDTSKTIETLAISKTFTFSDGDYVPEKFSSTWAGLDLEVKETKRGKFKRADPGNFLNSSGRSLWHRVTDFMTPKLPHVVYFPNFIVDVPRRIYINSFSGESTVNTYYRRIIQYALSESDAELSLSKHVLDRIEKFKSSVVSENWISALMSSDEKDKIDAVFSRLSVILTNEVLGAWGRVFNRPAAAIRIETRWNVDPENEQPFVEIKVSNGRSSYHLHQRSLGFRWFFSFLLFTRFGRDRSRANIFLFDEPAANLHARAQAELLSSFGKIAEDGDIIVYSTHSQHMINPEWLSGAYIVENEAIDYDETETGYAPISVDTNIKATPYRRFVGENGNKISYFQPVLERLQYVEPKIVPSGRQILVEGISDFYALSYALKRSVYSEEISIVPGTGSGSLTTLTSLALSRGHNFLILLDDDSAGQKAAQRYKDIFFLDAKRVVTLGQLLPNNAGMALEGLLSEDTKDLIASRYGNRKKSSIGHYLAEACATNDDGLLSEITLRRLDEVIGAAVARLNIT